MVFSPIGDSLIVTTFLTRVGWVKRQRNPTLIGFFEQK